MSPTNRLSINRDLLTKLDVIIDQHEQIIKENKKLKDRNDELMESNIKFKQSMEKSESIINGLNEKMNQMIENIKMIQSNTSCIEDNLKNFSKITANVNSIPSKTKCSNDIQQKHSVIISPKEETGLFNPNWKKKVKSDITAKLSNVQVNKLSLTKNGKYYVDIPNKENQEKAVECLSKSEEFNIKAETKEIGLTPKITLCDLDPESYKIKDHEKLKKNILSKNPEIFQLVQDGKIFEILFIK